MVYATGMGAACTIITRSARIAFATPDTEVFKTELFML
jgi:hypothetical protein